MFLLFGRFLCELWVNDGERHEGLTVRATYSLEYDYDEGSNLAALCFHGSNWGWDRMEKERKKAFASVVVGGR